MNLLKLELPAELTAAARKVEVAAQAISDAAARIPGYEDGLRHGLITGLIVGVLLTLAVVAIARRRRA